MKPYYQDEFVTLYHGDCRELIARAVDGRVVSVIADPPYGETTLEWDRWQEGWVRAIGDALPWTSSLWCFGSMRMFLNHLDDFAGWKLAQDVVWEKHNGSSPSSDRFRRVHEYALQWYRGDWESVVANPVHTNDATKRTVRRKERPPQWGAIANSTYTSEDGGPRLMRSVMYARSEHGHAENETQKPLAIVRNLILTSSNPGDVIVSAFAGSGTDLVAAKHLGRRGIGFEVRESQCEVAAKRLSQNVLDFGGAA